MKALCFNKGPFNVRSDGEAFIYDRIDDSFEVAHRRQVSDTVLRMPYSLVYSITVNASHLDC